ncbi:PstS family phosphate ABC transporter substrate-binding protein [Desulfosoma caldarium]|uniref:Phosphate ABC transporter substrate-binding protein (PhoT family) n=1 Tax=Desulfosoma caldarium TaxID=610254 RepID=A0A3N1UT29_9BACT|nr:PstS family phosphate ABC transporter substrate-binding protein [Desulfosoma caldarium]ROQ91001.1 phosphate ABC transporter substrate-binding protein (PhoT family) [Desulfosoma caldarium]
MKPLGLVVLCLSMVGVFQAPLRAQARDYIYIAGSSTVYPFSTVVAEQFGKALGFKTPKVESTGTGGGFKLFCAGVGVEHSDISNASRAIKKSELETCVNNGVREVVEVRIGYDGIVLANSKKASPMQLRLKDIFLALAAQIPDPKGGSALVKNPYKTWKDVNPSLPDQKIEVLGPPPTSGTRDAFLELAMEKGALELETLKALKQTDKKAFKKVAHSLREDGAWIDAGENDNLIVQKLWANPRAMGVFGFSYLDQNTDKLQGAHVEGVAPTFESISAQQYPLSRPLFFYVKKAHVGSIPGILEFVQEFTDEKAWGPEGYLADKGLIPLPEAERSAMREAARAMKPMAVQ